MIADVVFDLPLDHPFSYRVPDHLKLGPGQRVSAPLRGRRTRVGIVVALREGEAEGLRPLEQVVDPAPIVSAAGLALGRWIADESLSSWGSTLLALLPPRPRAKRVEAVAPRGGTRCGALDGRRARGATGRDAGRGAGGRTRDRS